MLIYINTCTIDEQTGKRTPITKDLLVPMTKNERKHVNISSHRREKHNG